MWGLLCSCIIKVKNFMYCDDVAARCNSDLYRASARRGAQQSGVPSCTKLVVWGCPIHGWGCPIHAGHPPFSVLTGKYRKNPKKCFFVSVTARDLDECELIWLKLDQRLCLHYIIVYPFLQPVFTIGQALWAQCVKWSQTMSSTRLTYNLNGEWYHNT